MTYASAVYAVGGDGKRADRETVEAVGQVDGVARADEHERGKRDVEPTEVGNQLLEERKDQPRVVQVVAPRATSARDRRPKRDDELQAHLLAGQQSTRRRGA